MGCEEGRNSSYAPKKRATRNTWRGHPEKWRCGGHSPKMWSGRRLGKEALICSISNSSSSSSSSSSSRGGGGSSGDCGSSSGVYGGGGGCDYCGCANLEHQVARATKICRWHLRHQTLNLRPSCVPEEVGVNKKSASPIGKWNRESLA